MNNWALGFIVYVLVVGLAVCRMYCVGKDKPARPKEEDDWQMQEINRVYQLRKMKKQRGYSERRQTIVVLLLAGLGIWAIDHHEFVGKFFSDLFHSYVAYKI